MDDHRPGDWSPARVREGVPCPEAEECQRSEAAALEPARTARGRDAPERCEEATDEESRREEVEA